MMAVVAIMAVTTACARKLTLSETRTGPELNAADASTSAQQTTEQRQPAQNSPGSGELVSFVLGAQKASIFGGESWKDPIGTQIGANLPVLKINKSVSLRVEANISMQGAKWEEFALKGRTNLLYFNAPLVVRYQIESGFFGEAGLQPGFLLRAKDKYEGTTDDYMDHMNRFDLSIPLEVGYMFKNSVGVGLRVIPGLNDITKDEEEKDRNFVVALRGIYTFIKK